MKDDEMMTAPICRSLDLEAIAAALEPFALAADCCDCPETADLPTLLGHPAADGLTVNNLIAAAVALGDLRRARAEITKLRGGAE